MRIRCALHPQINYLHGHLHRWRCKYSGTYASLRWYLNTINVDEWVNISYWYVDACHPFYDIHVNPPPPYSRARIRLISYLQLLYMMFIICNIDMITFSSCVFLCVCLSMCVCRDVYPEDWTMKDWHHTNHILQGYGCGGQVVQVMCCSLMTSSMT